MIGSGKELTSPPLFEPSDKKAPELEGVGSGTVVRIRVDENSRFGRIKGADYNNLETWSLVLRTYTSIGVITVGDAPHLRPWWLSNLQVVLELKGVAGEGTRTVPPTFRYPHNDVATSVSLAELWAGTVPGNARFEMLYVELGKDALEQILKGPIDDLENSDNPESREILDTLRRYETEVYASWGYKNTLYEDIYRTALSDPSAKRTQYMNVHGGMLVASVGMPIGETTDHPYITLKPEQRRRLFFIAAFNDRYSPDLGRKTVPTKDRVMLEWLERQIQNLFVRQESRLVKSNDESPHNAGGFSEAKEELADQIERIRKKHASQSPLAPDLVFCSSPGSESELVGTFYTLLATKRLRGYTLLSVPGSRTRFDGVFDFETTEFDDGNDESPRGISATKAKESAFTRRSKWLEFKMRLEDLVSEFEADDGDAGKNTLTCWTWLWSGMFPMVTRSLTMTSLSWTNRTGSIVSTLP